MAPKARRVEVTILGPSFPSPPVRDEDYSSECDDLFTTAKPEEEDEHPGLVQVMMHKLRTVTDDSIRFRTVTKEDTALIPEAYVDHVRFINHLRTQALLWHHLRGEWRSPNAIGWEMMAVYLTKVMVQFVARAAFANDHDSMTDEWRCQFFDELLTREFYGVPHTKDLAEEALREDRAGRIDLKDDPFDLGESSSVTPVVIPHPDINRLGCIR